MVFASRKDETGAGSSYDVHVLEHPIVYLWLGQYIMGPAAIFDWRQAYFEPTRYPLHSLHGTSRYLGRKHPDSRPS